MQLSVKALNCHTEIIILQRYFSFFVLSFFSFGFNQKVFSAITPIQELDFGTIVVVDNSSQSSITITSSGNILPTNKIWVTSEGNPAEFLITGYLPHTTLFTTVNIVSVTTITSGAPTEQFTLIAVETPASIITSGAGEGRVLIGGTLQTTGSGTAYNNTTYEATYNLDVSF